MIFTFLVKYIIFDPEAKRRENSNSSSSHTLLYAQSWGKRWKAAGAASEHSVSRVGRKRRSLDDKVSYMFETLATLVCF